LEIFIPSKNAGKKHLRSAGNILACSTMDNAVLQTLMDTDHEVHTGKDRPVRVAMHSVLITEIGEKKKTRLPNGKSCMEQAGGMLYTEHNQQFGQSKKAKICSRTAPMLDVTRMTTTDNMTVTSMAKKLGKV